MATEKEKRELIETLKFTPRTYKLTIWGYGGEIAIGRLNEAQYEYWKEKDEADIIEHCTSYFGEDDNAIDIPKEARFVEDGAWYETEGHLDSMSGCEFSDLNHIQIDDENGETVFDQGLSWELEENHGVQLEQGETYASDWDDVDGYFCVQSTEKGQFFSADLELKAPFDPNKLKIHTVDFEGWELVTGVDYDGEELDGFDGYDTTGKGYYASINLT